MNLRRIIFLNVIIILLLFSGNAFSSDPLDVQAELSRPGVKLVAVEFYATWCKPCMEAVPRWKKLHQKYGSKGLRFIVVSVGDDGQCSNPGWSPDRNICDIDGTIQDDWDVADLPQAFLYSWQGDLLAERAHAGQVEDAIKRFFSKTQLRLYIDEIDVYGDKYAISGNPNWLKEYITSQIRKSSKFDVLKYRKAPNFTASDHCTTDFPANSNLRILLQGDDTGNRTLTLKIEKDGCVLASSQKPYSGQGFKEDRNSLKRAAEDAVKEILASVIHIKKPTPPQVFSKAGFGEGLNDLDDLRGSNSRLGGMSRLDIPRGSMDDFDTNYMDLIVAAGETDKSKTKTVQEKISAWQKVADYKNKTFAREKAKSRIKEWREWYDARVKKAIALKKAEKQYQEDKKKLAKILSYPETYVSKAQKQAYENEFNRAYRDVKQELEQVASGKHELMSLINDKYLGTYGDMVDVPAGDFWMGCNKSVDSECDSNEYPYRKVYLSAFKIDRTEVTVAQFSECVKAGRCSSNGLNTPYWNGKSQMSWKWACNWGQGRDDHPINCVDWRQAKTYCEWAGKRLPTEAEWEKAARGTDGRKYSWGNTGFGTAKNVANIADETAHKKHSDWSYAKGYTDGYEGTSPVGSFPKGASPYGVLDMMGNVWEWVSDWYGSDYYKNGSTRNPTGPSSGPSRVLRSGSWFDIPNGNRTSNRLSYDPKARSVNFGFRCAK